MTKKNKSAESNQQLINEQLAWIEEGRELAQDLSSSSAEERKKALRIVMDNDPLLCGVLVEAIKYRDLYFRLTSQVYDKADELNEAADYDGEDDLLALLKPTDVELTNE